MLQIRGKIPGPDNPRMATWIDNLASVLCDEGNKWAEVEALRREALAIRTRLLDKDDVLLGWSFGNLACALENQAREGEIVKYESLGHRKGQFRRRRVSEELTLFHLGEPPTPSCNPTFPPPYPHCAPSLPLPCLQSDRPPAGLGVFGVSNKLRPESNVNKLSIVRKG